MLLNQQDSLLLLIDVQEKLTPLLYETKACVDRCAWLLKLATRMQVPILVSEQYPKGLGHTISALNTYVNAENCFEKVHFSSMQDPKYVQAIRQTQKTQLIVIGIETHVCVLQTAMEMKEMGFEVYVVVDAVSSRAEQDLKYGLKRMKQVGIHLVTSEMVFFEWVRTAGHPQFKALSKEFFVEA